MFYLKKIIAGFCLHAGPEIEQNILNLCLSNNSLCFGEITSLIHFWSTNILHSFNSFIAFL